jgi:hypothetical protein
MKWLLLIIACLMIPAIALAQVPNRRLGNVTITNNNSGVGNCPVTTGTNAGTWQPCAAGSMATGLVSGVLNVKDAPYGAKGDNSTDDTTAIQAAVYAATGWDGSACGSGPYPPVYFPKGKYKITQPLHEPCPNLTIFAADQRSGVFLSGYYGPSWLVEPYGAENLTYGPALIGTGLSVATSSSGFISLSELIDDNVTTTLNGATGMDTEVGFEITAYNHAPTYNIIFASDIARPDPNAGTLGYVTIRLNSGDTTDFLVGCVHLSSGNPCITSSTKPSLNTPHDVAVDYRQADSLCRMFLDGVLIGSTACTGTIKQSPFETAQIPSLQSPVWPFSTGQATAITGYVGPIRIEAASLHTANYTPVTLVGDGNNYALSNFQASPDGTQIATYGAGSLSYLPVHANNAPYQIPHVHMHDMHVGSWIEATWAWQSEFDHISADSVNASYGVIDLSFTDFETSVHDNTWVGPSALGINYGPGFAEGIASNNQGGVATVGFSCNNQCSMRDNRPVVIAGSLMVYDYVVDGGHVDIDSFPFADMEGADTPYQSAFYFANNYAPSIIVGGEVSTYGGKPYVTIVGGEAPKFIGTGFDTFAQDQPANRVYNFVSAPTSQLISEGVQSPTGVAISNSPQYVSTPGCGGPVTLVAGAGTLTKACISTASICKGTDTTTFANAVTFAAPANGSVALTGTGTDVIRVECQ